MIGIRIVRGEIVISNADYRAGSKY